MHKTLIYQMLPRLWGNMNKKCLKGGTLKENGSGHFSDITEDDLKYIKGLGMEYLWYTGIIRHSTVEGTDGCIPSHPQFVKGRAGSPYAICDYYDVNHYLADDPADRMKEFEALIQRTHKAGLKVIIDFVPNHVARDYGKVTSQYMPCGTVPLGAEDDKNVHWRAENDFFYYPGTPLRLPNEEEFKAANPDMDIFHEDPAKASGNTFTPAPGICDWYETIKINYCDFHTVTWDKMLDIVMFWASKGVDGFRCDMVELVPWQFFQWMIAKVKQTYRNIIFIAEVYDKNLYGKYANEVGFDLLYDKSGLYDVLLAIEKGHASCRQITWNWQNLGESIVPNLLNFIENHDEPRFPSDEFAGTRDREFAHLYTSLFLNTTPFMVYFGEEAGERGMDDEGFSGKNNRTTIFDWWSLESIRKIRSGKLPKADKAFFEKFKTALVTAATDPVIRFGKTFDLCYCNGEWGGFNQDRHFAFLRAYNGKAKLVVSNFSHEDANLTLNIPIEAYNYLGLGRNVPSQVEAAVKAGDGVIIDL